MTSVGDVTPSGIRDDDDGDGEFTVETQGVAGETQGTPVPTTANATAFDDGEPSSDGSDIQMREISPSVKGKSKSGGGGGGVVSSLPGSISNRASEDVENELMPEPTIAEVLIVSVRCSQPLNHPNSFVHLHCLPQADGVLQAIATECCRSLPGMMGCEWSIIEQTPSSSSLSSAPSQSPSPRASAVGPLVHGGASGLLLRLRVAPELAELWSGEYRNAQAKDQLCDTHAVVGIALHSFAPAPLGHLVEGVMAALWDQYVDEVARAGAAEEDDVYEVSPSNLRLGAFLKKRGGRVEEDVEVSTGSGGKSPAKGIQLGWIAKVNMGSTACSPHGPPCPEALGDAESSGDRYRCNFHSLSKPAQIASAFSSIGLNQDFKFSELDLLCEIVRNCGFFSPEVQTTCDDIVKSLDFVNHKLLDLEQPKTAYGSIEKLCK